MAREQLYNPLVNENYSREVSKWESVMALENLLNVFKIMALKEAFGRMDAGKAHFWRNIRGMMITLARYMDHSNKVSQQELYSLKLANSKHRKQVILYQNALKSLDLFQ